MTFQFSNLRPAVAMTALMTLVLGLAYPLAMTGIAQSLFPSQANGSLVERGGKVIGSALVGQSFTEPRYLIGRPSAVDYDAANSGGSNLGPTSRALIASVRERVETIRTMDDTRIPSVERVTASASGLDPHLSVAGALEQAGRIARVRKTEAAKVRAIIQSYIEEPHFGFVGEPIVNVLLVNLALDAAFPASSTPQTSNVTIEDGRQQSQ